MKRFKLSHILMDYSIKREYEMTYKVNLKNHNDFIDQFDIKELLDYFKQFENIKIDKNFYIFTKTIFFYKHTYDYSKGLNKQGLDVLFDNYSFTKKEKQKLNYLFDSDSDEDMEILHTIYKKFKTKINNIYYKTYDINVLRRKKYERIL